jgi:hypothetical protein
MQAHSLDLRDGGVLRSPFLSTHTKHTELPRGGATTRQPSSLLSLWKEHGRNANPQSGSWSQWSGKDTRHWAGSRIQAWTVADWLRFSEHLTFKPCPPSHAHTVGLSFPAAQKEHLGAMSQLRSVTVMCPSEAALWNRNPYFINRMEPRKGK